MGMEAYGIGGTEFLLRGNDPAGALGGVECGLALHDGLALGGAATGLAADLGNGVPVIHVG